MHDPVLYPTHVTVAFDTSGILEASSSYRSHRTEGVVSVASLGSSFLDLTWPGHVT